MPMQRICVRFALIVAAVTMSGCASETLFRSNFDATPEGQPPSPNQAVGTAAVFGPPGSVKIVTGVPGLNGKFLEISRPTGPDVAGMQGKFSEFRGNGRYTFSATVVMPVNSQVATIQFEQFTNPSTSLSAFMHLDFTPDNKVRIDDNDATKFGEFVRGQPFIVQVKFDISDTASTANIILSGGGASGERNHTITGPFQGQSRNFGAIRIWQGFPHTGHFDVQNVAVTRRTD
jgi:hypothetical protein